jgi:glycosyltransferase involved in cell wall biosynthesis
MSGRLVPWKGHVTFLQAVSKVLEAGKQLDAVIVGGGPDDYRRTLEELACRLGIKDRVSFLGHRADVRKLLCECDVAVHCSEREPFGLVVIEAMACGLPVIASDVEGPREILQDGVTGFLVPPGNADGYARVLGRLLADPALRAAVGRAAKEAAARRFCSETNVQLLEESMSPT